MSSLWQGDDGCAATAWLCVYAHVQMKSAGGPVGKWISSGTWGGCAQSVFAIWR